MPVLLVLLAVVGLPLLEILVFIEVGSEIGAFTTIALTVVTAASGLVLARIQGMNTLVRARAALERGDLPVADLLGGLGILAGAVLLLIPGFVSDTAGLLLLLPPVRALLLPGLVGWVASRHSRQRADGAVIIDAEFSDLDRPGNGTTLLDGTSRDRGDAGPATGSSPPEPGEHR